MLRVLSVSLLLIAFVACLPASPPQEPQVTISFTNAPLAEVLKLYEDLQGGILWVSEPLRQKLVSINSEGPVPHGEAIKLIQSSLLKNYDILIEPRGFTQSAFTVLDADEGRYIVRTPLVPPPPRPPSPRYFGISVPNELGQILARGMERQEWIQLVEIPWLASALVILALTFFTMWRFFKVGREWSITLLVFRLLALPVLAIAVVVVLVNLPLTVVVFFSWLFGPFFIA
jgi:hypothetical protein